MYICMYEPQCLFIYHMCGEKKYLQIVFKTKTIKLHTYLPIVGRRRYKIKTSVLFEKKMKCFSATQGLM